MKILAQHRSGNRRRGVAQIDDVNDRTVMPSRDMLAHVSLNFATILAIGTLKARLEPALVSEMPIQISLPIKRLAAVRARTDVNAGLRFPIFRFLSPRLAVRPPSSLLEICNKAADAIFF